MELVEGDRSSLERIERALRAAGALDADERPKLFRALGLVRDERAPPERKAPAIEHLTWMLERQYRAILVHDPGTRLGSDPEQLHQHRVAIRRLRALLRASRPMLDDGWVDEVRAELAWAGRALGEVRDLDVLLEHLRADAAALGDRERSAFEALTGRIGERRDKARRLMLAALRSTRYVRLLERLESELRDPPPARRRPTSGSTGSPGASSGAPAQDLAAAGPTADRRAAARGPPIGQARPLRGRAGRARPRRRRHPLHRGGETRAGRAR